MLCATLALAPLCTLWQCLRKLGHAFRAWSLRAPPPTRSPVPQTNLPPACWRWKRGWSTRHRAVPHHARQWRRSGRALNASARRAAAPGRPSGPKICTSAGGAAGRQRRLITFDPNAVARAGGWSPSRRCRCRARPASGGADAGGKRTGSGALNAWRELVPSADHEIMNSLTPVASLSRTACGLLDEAAPDCPPNPRRSGIALDAIAPVPASWWISSAAIAACRRWRRRSRSACSWRRCSSACPHDGATVAGPRRKVEFRWSRRRWR